ncbi:MAG: GIY-YIG nuclease family protein [Acidobacteria bacterium]|nr:GIY-YIG nuclease family protein [Acidobacteriota bacterium]
MMDAPKTLPAEVEGDRSWVLRDDFKSPQRRVKRSGIKQTIDRKFFRSGLYLLIGSNGLCKIGRSENLYNRIANLWTTIPDEFEVFALFATEAHIHCERVIHEKFKDRRIKGEWFALQEGNIEELIEKYGFCLINKKASEFLDVYSNQ